MDLIDGIPDWLTCGVVIVVAAGVLQLLQICCERSLRQIGRDVDGWRATQPDLHEQGLAYSVPEERPGRRDPPPLQAA